MPNKIAFSFAGSDKKINKFNKSRGESARHIKTLTGNQRHGVNKFPVKSCGSSVSFCQEILDDCSMLTFLCLRCHPVFTHVLYGSQL